MKTVAIEDRRELYKAMRSAHDGICPLCGGVAEKVRLYLSHGVRCEDGGCDFDLSGQEIAEIRSWHAIFHRDLGAVLRRYRMKDITS